jgi:TM2 domain-containing membrane protein YozV
MYIVIAPDGKEHGPVDFATLQTWARNGNITPAFKVVDPIDGMTKVATDLPEISQLFPPAPTPTPQPPLTPQNNFGTQQHVTVNVTHPSMTVMSPPKSKVTAVLLAFFFGLIGAHRFYLGHSSTGVVMLLIFLFGWALFLIPDAVLVVWVLIDIVLILTGGLKDNFGRELT